MNENAKKWVAALRSGEYEQGKDALQSTAGYCCLGVACAVYEKEVGPVQKGWDGRFRGKTLYPHKNVLDWLGLRDESGDFRGDYFPGLVDDDGYDPKCDSLAEANDAGATFSEIADFIESEPEGLFND